MNRRVPARDRALNLARALDRAREIADIIERVQLLHRSSREEATARATGNAPGRVTWRLVALAVRVLPARDRPRYEEEFRNELVELRRRYRFRYALQVFLAAWELRQALAEGTSARRVAQR